MATWTEVAAKSGDWNIRNGRSYKRLFRSLDTASTASTASVLLDFASTTSIEPGVTAPNDAYSYCTSIAPEQSGQSEWYVTVTYENLTVQGFGGGSATGGSGPLATSQSSPSNYGVTPENRTAIWQIDGIEKKNPMRVDLAGQEVVNSAGDPFLPVKERDSSIGVITVTCYKTSWTVAHSAALANRVNSSAWVTPLGTFDELTCKCLHPRAIQVYENNVGYWQLTFTVHVLYDDIWSPITVLDEGYRYRDATTGVLLNATDAGGNPVSQPVLLDGDGNLASLPYRPPGTRNFYVYYSANFNGLIP